jgi:hypothetical protein
MQSTAALHSGLAKYSERGGVASANALRRRRVWSAKLRPASHLWRSDANCSRVQGNKVRPRMNATLRYGRSLMIQRPIGWCLLLLLAELL